MPEDRASDKARNSGKLLKSPDRDTTRGERSHAVGAHVAEGHERAGDPGLVSAVPPIATKFCGAANVRFVPIADMVL